MSLTISDSEPRRQYTGNGVQTAFSANFEFRAASDVVCNVDGVVKTLNTDYTLTGAGVSGGGTLTFSVAPANGAIITIYRDMPIARTADQYASYGQIPAEVLEQDLDDITMKMQQLEVLIGRASRVSMVEAVSSSSMEWPSKAARAGNYAYWNATTGNLEPATQLTAGTTLSQSNIGDFLWPRTSAEIAAGKTPTAYYYASGPVVDARRFGVAGDNSTDSTTALNNALASLNGRGTVVLPPGTVVVSSQIVVPTGVMLMGAGFSSIHGTGTASAGGTRIRRNFTGTSATIALNNDDSGLDLIDVDGASDAGVKQGTGDGIQMWGSRCIIGRVSSRNAGGSCVRIGRTNSGASSTNTNAWRIDYLVVTGATSHGLYIDDTNTTTSLSHPLGISNANAGYCGLVDARSCGGDGVRIGNANDNVFGMVVSQSNTGCGLRFFTDGTNSGPRCNHILGNDCEANTGNDIQIDAATLPVSGPGLYNVVLGNRSVAISSRIVDNSTGSLVQQWYPGLSYRAYHSGPHVNALASSGEVGFNAYVGSNASPVRFYGVASGTVDGKARISVHKNGGSQTDGCEVNENAVFRPFNNLVTVAYTASMTIDAAQGHIFSITATNGTAFTINAPTNPYTGQRIQINIRNNSGGALGAVTWNAVFKMTAWTSPATGNQRVINFYYDGSNWIMCQATTNDVPL